MTLKVATNHGWPKASDGTDANAFDAFKNERDYIAQNGKMTTTVAAMDWAVREIEHLQRWRSVRKCPTCGDQKLDPISQ